MTLRSLSCLICENEARLPVLDLGETPLANALLSADELGRDEPYFPLRVERCPACGLVQLGDLVPPEILFRHYLYTTGTSSTMTAHSRDTATGHVARFDLGPTDLVAEIASNDGTLLSCFQDLGTAVLGIEPAENLAALANERGVRSVPRFFGRDAAPALREEFGPASLICGNNVLAHVPDPVGLLAGARHLVEPKSGVVSIEVPWLLPMVERLEWDTIYHEHLSYFSMRALAEAFRRAGLAVFDVEKLPVHGGTLRVLARPGDEHGPVVRALVDEEDAAGLSDDATWERFAARVDANRRALKDLLIELRGTGHSVAAYGAAAKGNTLLNCCDIGPELVTYVADRNPLKVGRYTPGTHLPITSVEHLLEKSPDHVLILPWNLADEIRSQLDELRARGGRFLVPIPEPRVLP